MPMRMHLVKDAFPVHIQNERELFVPLDSAQRRVLAQLLWRFVLSLGDGPAGDHYWQAKQGQPGGSPR